MIKYTKKGQPYIIDKRSGKARFIKKTTSPRRRIKQRGRNQMTKRKRYGKSNGIMSNLNKPVVGALGVIAYESLISPMIPLQGVSKDLLELVGGLYLSKKGGFLGATGKSLVVINSYQLLSGLVGNKLQGLLGGQATSSYNYEV